MCSGTGCPRAHAAVASHALSVSLRVTRRLHHSIPRASRLGLLSFRDLDHELSRPTAGTDQEVGTLDNRARCSRSASSRWTGRRELCIVGGRRLNLVDGIETP